MSPQEAVQAFQDLRGINFIPIHWGTFGLADEPLDNPPQELKKEIQKRNLNEENFWILKHGETRNVKKVKLLHSKN
jgi:L-ascorbate metabolism protein UlaG (beta-lactamase superfamily)